MGAHTWGCGINRGGWIIDGDEQRHAGGEESVKGITSGEIVEFATFECSAAQSSKNCLAIQKTRIAAVQHLRATPQWLVLGLPFHSWLSIRVPNARRTSKGFAKLFWLLLEALASDVSGQ
eukprot:8606396-Pyramimonas_sp.AAC.1